MEVGPETLLADEEVYLLDEEERQFFRDYANLDSSKKSQLKGYMDRIQDEKKKDGGG